VARQIRVLIANPNAAIAARAGMSREQIRAGLGEAAPAAFQESWIRFLRLVAEWSAKTSQNAPAAISESPKAVWRRPQLWGRAEAARDCVDGAGVSAPQHNSQGCLPFRPIFACP